MNILLTLDENYLLPCKVMLDSFFASNPAETDVTVYLLHSASLRRSWRSWRRSALPSARH